MGIERVLASSLLAFCGLVDAADVGSYLKAIEARNSKDAATADYARGVVSVMHQTMSDTMMFMNHQARENGTPIFCLPKDYALSGSTVEDILFSTIKTAQRNGDKGVLDRPVAVYVVLGMMKSFPCK